MDDLLVSGPKKRKSRWVSDPSSPPTAPQQPSLLPASQSTLPFIPSGAESNSYDPVSPAPAPSQSDFATASSPFDLNPQQQQRTSLLEHALLLSPLPHEIPPEYRPNPLNPTLRVSRWSIANEQREVEVQQDIQIGPNFWQSVKQHPTIQVPEGLTAEQTSRVGILHYQIEDLYKRMKMPKLYMDKIPTRDRSPSPEPTYDISGNRLNTREQRFATLCESTRGRLIREMITVVPNYQAEGYKKERPFRNVTIPVDERPTYNFSGLIIGPRGTTHQKMEADFNCKISIRGRLPNEVKPKKNEWSNDPAHVHIEGDDEEQVIACAGAISDLILMSSCPDDMNDHKSRQLQELSKYNGTIAEVRENHRQLSRMMERQRNTSNYQGPGVLCTSCGSKTHITLDCPFKDRDFVDEIALHEQSLIGGNEFLDLSTAHGEGITAPSRQRLVKDPNWNVFTGGGARPTNLGSRGGDAGSDDGGILDLSQPNQMFMSAPIDMTSVSNTGIPPPPPPNYTTTTTNNNNNNGNNYQHQQQHNQQLPIGSVKTTPQGSFVLTPGGPMLFTQMTNDQKTRLAREVVQNMGMDNPYCRLLSSLDLDPVMVLNGGLMQQQQQQQQQPIYQHQQSQQPPQQLQSTIQMMAISAGTPLSAPTATQKALAVQSESHAFHPPAPPGIGPLSESTTTTNFPIPVPPSNPTDFQPPPPPGTISIAPQSHHLQQQQQQQIPSTIEQPKSPIAQNQHAPIYPSSQPLTVEQIQIEYGKAYQHFWSTFFQQTNREPTEDEWYHKWNNEVLPMLQRGGSGGGGAR